MNVSTLRKNYERLSMLERLSLADQAEARDDVAELTAINAASPKQTYRQVDFLILRNEITTFRLCNVLARLGYVMAFDYFLKLAEREEGGESGADNRDRHVVSARLAAYLYVRATDSWNAINDNLGLRPDFDGELEDCFLSVGLMLAYDGLMRDMAYDEEEMQRVGKEVLGIEKLTTLEDEISMVEEALGLDI